MNSEFYIHFPRIEDLSAPATRHDVACSVCWCSKAVLDMNAYVFQPCWECQSNGWKLRKTFWKRFKVALFEIFKER